MPFNKGCDRVKYEESSLTHAFTGENDCVCVKAQKINFLRIPEDMPSGSYVFGDLCLMPSNASRGT